MRRELDVTVNFLRARAREGSGAVSFGHEVDEDRLNVRVSQRAYRRTNERVAPAVDDPCGAIEYLPTRRSARLLARDRLALLVGHRKPRPKNRLRLVLVESKRKRKIHDCLGEKLCLRL